MAEYGLKEGELSSGVRAFHNSRLRLGVSLVAFFEFPGLTIFDLLFSTVLMGFTPMAFLLLTTPYLTINTLTSILITCLYFDYVNRRPSWGSPTMVG